MKIGSIAPILRSLDEAKARAFYLDYLGFQVLFEHRFEPHLPLYMGIRRDTCELHLSEHLGDASPGAGLRIAVEDLDAFLAELQSRSPLGARAAAAPSIETMPWGTRDLRLTDPFGNRLTFTSALSL